ncbi:MAG: threonine ammonia-lyase [Chloroflexi bacterium]|nr:threonine ammonia-lyase [Chloroflexota bacterium]
MITLEIPIGLAEIEASRQRIARAVRHTDLIRSEVFSRQCGAELYLKLENLQSTGSFKIRGAFNKLAWLMEQPLDKRPKGVIAVSAGNHAQGVASAAATCGVPATVVMPLGASLTKIRACQEMGATVLQRGATLEEAFEEAMRLAAEHDYFFMHPYNDWQVIAGQASVGLEVLEDLPEVETVVAPVGGGGLLAGIALALKLKKPSVRVIGVQTEAISPYFGFIQSGQFSPVQADAITIADGIRVKLPGDKNAAIIRRYVDDIITVSDSQISEAIVALMERTHTLTEGAGAVGLAALLHHKIPVRPDEKVVTILSGGNIDVTLVGRIIDFGLVSSGRYLVIALILPDRPGQLVRLLSIIAELGMNIRQIEHRRGEMHVPVGLSEVILQVETKDQAHQQQLLNQFKAEHLEVRNLTKVVGLYH